MTLLAFKGCCHIRCSCKLRQSASSAKHSQPVTTIDSHLMANRSHKTRYAVILLLIHRVGTYRFCQGPRATFMMRLKLRCSRSNFPSSAFCCTTRLFWRNSSSWCRCRQAKITFSYSRTDNGSIGIINGCHLQAHKEECISCCSHTLSRPVLAANDRSCNRVGKCNRHNSYPYVPGTFYDFHFQSPRRPRKFSCSSRSTRPRRH